MATLAARATRLAGAALRGHRRVRGPPIGRLPSIDAGAPVVQQAPVGSGAAVGERFVSHGVGGKLIGRGDPRLE